jgi:hypothetical protein
MLTPAAARDEPRVRLRCARTSDALEVPLSEVFKLEEVAEKSARALRDDHRVRFGDALQSSCEVWGRPDHCLLLSSARTNQVTNNDKPSRDADAGLQRCIRLQIADRCNQLQPRAYSTLGIIFMRPWGEKVTARRGAPPLAELRCCGLVPIGHTLTFNQGRGWSSQLAPGINALLLALSWLRLLQNGLSPLMVQRRMTRL